MATYEVKCMAGMALGQKIEANSPEEAIEIAERIFIDQLRNGHHVLTKNDLSDDFQVFDERGEEIELE